MIFQLLQLQVPPPPPTLPPPSSSSPILQGGEAVYTEPGTTTTAPYTEPYRPMRYSPYYGYGPVLTEIEDSLSMRQSLLSGEGKLIFPH